MATVTFNNTTVAVTDLTCSSVKPAVTAALAWGSGWSATSCTSDPVQANTIITFTSGTSTWQGVITAVVNNPVSSTTAISPSCTPESFDYTYAAQVWAAAFCVTVGLYLVALKVGTILRFFRGA